jgi:glycosyltransferase involved in cell wall biosynthesis
MMRVLHIWDMAGVATLLARDMDAQFGTRSVVVHGGSRIRFYLKCLRLWFWADVIHNHMPYKPLFLLLRLVTPWKTYVVHWHGTQIRLEGWRRWYWYWALADIVLVASSDLLDGSPPGVRWLPTPVDRDLFRDYGKHSEGLALTFSKWADERAKQLAAERRLRLDIIPTYTIPHSKLPDVLNKYEYYIDAKRDVDLRTIVLPPSKTALEALSCGCKVIDWNSNLITEFPPEHDSRSVSRLAYSIYTRAGSKPDDADQKTD